MDSRIGRLFFESCLLEIDIIFDLAHCFVTDLTFSVQTNESPALGLKQFPEKALVGSRVLFIIFALIPIFGRITVETRCEPTLPIIVIFLQTLGHIITHPLLVSEFLDSCKCSTRYLYLCFVLLLFYGLVIFAMQPVNERWQG